MTDEDQLCLKCRCAGHVLSNCKLQERPHGSWSRSREREEFLAKYNPDDISSLCARCKSLNLYEWLSPSTNPTETATEITDEYRDLGSAKDVRFHVTCGCCRALLATCPHSPNDDSRLILGTTSTLLRVEGSIVPSRQEYANFGKALSMSWEAQDRTIISTNFKYVDDTLCFVDNAANRPLSGRVIGDEINPQLIHDWIASCRENHAVTCKTTKAHELESINVVDVHSRTIVPYPQDKPDYLTLSYCWGGVEQPSLEKGSVLPDRLPQTIEDAMKLVKMLGKQYLWVDSACIDQHNDEEKTTQIQFMSTIYQNSWLTIVALSAKSADSGIARLSRDAAVSPQVRCQIDGRPLVGTGISLSAAIFTEKWGSRAWTFQEALLSTRVLYLTDQQMYFECNAMQCSESLDDSHSWIHHVYRDEKFMAAQTNDDIIGSGVLRAPARGRGRLIQYGTFVWLYTGRHLTQNRDGLNAFTGILRYFEDSEYSKGFHWGLPVEDLNWALCWVHADVKTRRKEFPRWSWVGWTGQAGEMYPYQNWMHPHEFPVSVRITAPDVLGKGKTKVLFEQSGQIVNGAKDAERLCDDAYSKFCDALALPTAPITDSLNEAPSTHDLFIAGVTIKFDKATDFADLPWSSSDGSPRNPADWETVWISFNIGDQRLYMQTRVDVLESIFNSARTRIKSREHRFLIMARQKYTFQEYGDTLMYQVMVVKQSKDKKYAKRIGMLSLEVRMDQLGVLLDLEMQVGHFVLH